MALTREQQIQAIEKDWAENPRWKGIKRGYSAEDVVNLCGSLQPVHTLAQRGADLRFDLEALGVEPQADPTRVRRPVPGHSDRGAQAGPAGRLEHLLVTRNGAGFKKTQHRRHIVGRAIGQ